MEEQTQTVPAQVFPRDPAWWSDEHASAWDRVKDAFARDWEQTKADFGGGRSLNQGVVDTLAQAVGTERIPAAGVKTHQSDPKDAVREANEARTEMVAAAQHADERIATAKAVIAAANFKVDAKIAGAQRDLANAQVKANKVIADATQSAALDIQKQNVAVREASGMRDDAAARWRQAEQEARYGFAVRNRFPTDLWNEALESSLRTEWNAMGTGSSWEQSRAGIRGGWEYAGRV